MKPTILFKEKRLSEVLQNKKLRVQHQLKALFNAAENHSLLEEAAGKLKRSSSLTKISLDFKSIEHFPPSNNDTDDLVYKVAIPVSGFEGAFFSDPTYVHPPKILGKIKNETLWLYYPLEDRNTLQLIQRILNNDFDKLKLCIRFINIEIKKYNDRVQKLIGQSISTLPNLKESSLGVAS